MSEDNKLLEDFLNDWLNCNQVCDLAKESEVMKKLKQLNGWSKVDYYMEILPGADYVRTQTLNYIFSSGITTGSINEDEVLDAFLYQTNAEGVMNLNVLRNVIAKAISHGCCGARWYQGNIYQYDPGTYRALKLRNADGVLMTVAYVVSEDGKEVPTLKWADDDIRFNEYEDIVKYLRDQKLILLDTADFMNMRNDTSLDYGYSPLLHDKLRLDLLSATYERLNYDVRYDGPGRIVIRPKSGLIGEEGNEISTSSVLNQSVEAGKKRIDGIKEEARRVGREIKESSSDSVIVLSNAFDREITHLPRVTKATEFFDWIKNEGVILAQDFGMSPSLLELGGISGNVSMTSIIDNAIWNSIIPLREKYATQFSPFLAEHLEVSRAYFNMYELHQQANENTMRTQIVNIMSLLNAMNDDNDNTRPEALQLFRDFGEMLSDNIHNENNKLEEL
jgi:hypothetical protein